MKTGGKIKSKTRISSYKKKSKKSRKNSKDSSRTTSAAPIDKVNILNNFYDALLRQKFPNKKKISKGNFSTKFLEMFEENSKKQNLGKKMETQLFSLLEIFSNNNNFMDNLKDLFTKGAFPVDKKVLFIGKNFDKFYQHVNSKVQFGGSFRRSYTPHVVGRRGQQISSSSPPPIVINFFNLIGSGCYYYITGICFYAIGIVLYDTGGVVGVLAGAGVVGGVAVTMADIHANSGARFS